MPQTNLGSTSLKLRRRSANPMQEYDHLPRELRKWLADAILPWRAGSVQRAYQKALARTGDPTKAIGELNQLQNRIVAKDAKAVWGAQHPAFEPQAQQRPVHATRI